VGSDSTGVTDTAAQRTATPEEIIEDIAEQADDLCHIHDHITRVITNIEIEDGWFTGYDEPGRAKFDLEPMVKSFLYMYARGFSQSQLARRLRGAAYVYLRLGLDRPISQQIISHNERSRFDHDDRAVLKAAADCIQDVCADHDIVQTNEPALEPEDVQHEDVSEEQILRAVKRATNMGFKEFSANRASNTKFALDAYFERQGYLNMANAGATSKRRRFARVSERDVVPHGSSHNRTMGKIAAPDPQLSLDQFGGGDSEPMWKRVRDELLPPFHAGIEAILDEIAGSDREGIREPVFAAIDITPVEVFVSPFKSEDDVDPGEEPVTYTSNGTEKEKYLKDQFPDPISGLKDSNERGFQFATISIIAEDTPIVLGIEPVRDARRWEDSDEVETTSRGDIVERLLEQASQHVDIHKAFLDRGFDSLQVRDVIDRPDIQYVVGKTKGSSVDEENIEEIKTSDVYDGRVCHGSATYDGRTHDMTYVYDPSDRSDDDYVIWTMNGHVDIGRARALIAQYDQRMEIESQYATIKQHFLPKTSTMEYGKRFLYFLIGVVMFNVWRMANFILRDAVSVHLGEHPPINAGEIIELVAFCLFDPGG
jgi:hypothetical protein